MRYGNGWWLLASPFGPSSTWLLKSRPISTVCTVVWLMFPDRLTVAVCPAANPDRFCAERWLPGWNVTSTANVPASMPPLFLIATDRTNGWLGCGTGGLRVALTMIISGLACGTGVSVAGGVGEGIGVGGAATIGNVLRSPNTSHAVAMIQPLVWRKSIT